MVTSASHDTKVAPPSALVQMPGLGAPRLVCRSAINTRRPDADTATARGKYATELPPPMLMPAEGVSAPAPVAGAAELR